MIDAHHHLWRVGRNGFEWPPAALAPIHQDFEIEAFKAVAEPTSVRGAVLVQSQPADADTDYLLALAKDEPMILGVVGWADLAAPEACARIQALAAAPKLKGLRPMLQALAPDDWILSVARAEAVRTMARHRLAFDALVTSRHLGSLAVFARRHPDLTIIIDHGAKPDIAGGGLDPWRAAVSTLAGLPNVWCKLSGLVTEAGEDRSDRALAPYVDHLIAAFGAGRLIWGSDWPVLNLAGDYAGWLAQARALTARLGPEAQAAIFEGNARLAYDL